MYCKQLPGWQIERIAYFEKHQFLQFCFLNPVIIFTYQLSFLSSLVHLYRDRRVVHRVATSGTTSYGVWQRVATNDDEWYSEDKEWQRMVKQLTTSDREWQRMITNGNKWQWVTAIGKTNESGTIHIKERMISFFLWQKQIHYFKEWMAAIRVVRWVDCP